MTKTSTLLPCHCYGALHMRSCDLSAHALRAADALRTANQASGAAANAREVERVAIAAIRAAGDAADAATAAAECAHDHARETHQHYMRLADETPEAAPEGTLCGYMTCTAGGAVWVFQGRVTPTSNPRGTWLCEDCFGAVAVSA